MCGKDRCIYYGCDWCCRRLHGDILQLVRPECACLNDIYAEFCTEACMTRYILGILDCTCICPPTSVITTGRSQK